MRRQSLHLTRKFKSLGAASPSSGRSDMFIARQPYKSILKLRRSGTEVSGGPPTTGFQSSHAAPTELDRARGPLRYKHVAPAGACTDPCEDPCKVQGRAERRRRFRPPGVSKNARRCPSQSGVALRLPPHSNAACPRPLYRLCHWPWGESRKVVVFCFPRPPLALLSQA